MRRLIPILVFLLALPAFGLQHRRNTLYYTSNSRPAFAASYTVTAYKIGGECSQASPDATIELYAGHGFSAGDKILINPGSDDTYSGVDTVSSTTATSITMGSNYSVSKNDVVVNLGPDTGVAAPNYDGSPLSIYTDMASGTAVSDETVTTDATGVYEYYHDGSSTIWELVRDSSGNIVRVIKGVYDEDLTVPDDLTVTDDASFGGDMTVTGDLINYLRLGDGGVGDPRVIFCGDYDGDDSYEIVDDLQACIDDASDPDGDGTYSSATEGGTVFVLPGTYSGASTLSVHSSVSLLGLTSYDRGVIVKSTGTQDPVIDIRADSNSTERRVRIDGIRVDCDSYDGSGSPTGISLAESSGVTLQNVAIAKCHSIGLDIDANDASSAFYNQVVNPEIQYNRVGVRLDGGANANQFRGGVIKDNGVNLWIKDGGGNIFTGVALEAADDDWDQDSTAETFDLDGDGNDDEGIAVWVDCETSSGGLCTDCANNTFLGCLTDNSSVGLFNEGRATRWIGLLGGTDEYKNSQGGGVATTESGFVLMGEVVTETNLAESGTQIHGMVATGRAGPESAYAAAGFLDDVLIGADGVDYDGDGTDDFAGGSPRLYFRDDNGTDWYIHTDASGNLNIEGTDTTNDAVVVFQNNSGLNPMYFRFKGETLYLGNNEDEDLKVVLDRSTDDNVWLVWDESEDKWVFTFDGDPTGGDPCISSSGFDSDCDGTNDANEP